MISDDADDDMLKVQPGAAADSKSRTSLKTIRTLTWLIVTRRLDAHVSARSSICRCRSIHDALRARQVMAHRTG